MDLDLNIPWFLSADTARVWQMGMQQAEESGDSEEEAAAETTSSILHRLLSSKKLVLLEETKDPYQVGHVDRSRLDLMLNGIPNGYVSYQLLQEATAIVLSRSFFGETAAEVGYSGENAYYNDGCVKVDLQSI